MTLYTFACGDVCQSAEALLNRRGVPFTSVNVEEPANAARLQQLTGEMTAPVLQVGDKLVAKGYNEARWTTMLDEAGYPKAPRVAPDGGRRAARSGTAAPGADRDPRKGGGYPARRPSGRPLGRPCGSPSDRRRPTRHLRERRSARRPPPRSHASCFARAAARGTLVGDAPAA